MEFLPEGAIAFSDVKFYSTQSGVQWTNISKIFGPWDTGYGIIPLKSFSINSNLFAFSAPFPSHSTTIVMTSKIL